MRILVTGGAGYIGSHTVRVLCNRGHQVTVLDNLSAGHKAAVDPRATFVKADIAEREKVSALLTKSQIEGVIHFAASLSVAESVRDPLKYWRNNVAGTVELLAAMGDASVKRLVFSSTAATYGTPDVPSISEETPQSPINPYGHSKLAMERSIQDTVIAHQLGAISLRYFNAAGAAADGSLGEDHRPEEHLIPVILEVALKKREHIKIFGTDFPTADGTCVRDFIHVDDLAEAHVLALEATSPGKYRAYNVATGIGHSVREVIEEARRVTGLPIASIDAPRREGDPPVLVANSQRLMSELGWKPQLAELSHIIETAWRWMQQHPQGYEPT